MPTHQLLKLDAAPLAAGPETQQYLLSHMQHATMAAVAAAPLLPGTPIEERR